MKLKKGFVLKKINQKYYAVPVGLLASRHRVLISMNSTCLFVWEQLQCETTEDHILAALIQEYDVDPELARKDLSRFLTALRDAKLLEE